MGEDFRPRKYDVTREQLEAWRAAGESTVTIGSRFNPPAHHSTVRKWLIALGIPTAIVIAPCDEPPGKQPITKRSVYDAERKSQKSDKSQPSSNETGIATA